MPTYEFRAPNGKRISVNSKDGSTPTEGEVYGMFQKAYPDDESFQETVLERIGSAVGSAAQSAVGMGVKALEYFGKAAGNVPDTSLGRQTPIAVDQLRRSQPTVDPVLEGAKAAEAAVAEAVPTLPQARESFITGDVPSAVGSLAGGVTAGLVGGPAVAMGVMFGAEAQDAYDREIARQQKAGEQKNEDKAMFKATLYGTGATAIEYGLGAGYILRKIGEKFGKKAVGEVAEKVAETGWEKVAGALREGGKGGLAGFVEETAQSALQQKIVDGTVNWREAFREGAAGAVGQGGVATAVGLIPQSSQAVKDTDTALKEVVGEPGKIEGVPEAVQAANTPTEAPTAEAQPKVVQEPVAQPNQESAPEAAPVDQPKAEAQKEQPAEEVPQPETQPLKIEPWEEGQRPGVIEIQLISTKQRVADGIQNLLDIKNKKAAMIVPEWFNTGAVPEGLLVVPTAKGNVLFNPKKTSAKRIVRNLKRPDFNLGKQRRKPSPQTPQQQQGANEEVQKWQQEEVLSAGTASMPPVPERVDQIMEQLRLTGDPASTKAATLITPGSPIPAPTEGLVSVDTQHGTVIYNPNKITAQQVAQAASGEVFDGRVLGMASGATPIAGTTVVSTSTPAAPDVIAEVVQDTPSAIAEATIAQQKAVPGGDTQIKAATEVANTRSGPAAPNVGDEISWQTPEGKMFGQPRKKGVVKRLQKDPITGYMIPVVENNSGQEWPVSSYYDDGYVVNAASDVANERREPQYKDAPDWLPPVQPGYTRFYHGGHPGKGPRDLTPHYSYALGYAKKSGGIVQYVDIKNDEIENRRSYDDSGLPVRAPFAHFTASDEIMSRAKPVGRPTPRIEPPIESRDQTAPSRSVAWDYETITTTHEARAKWADEQVAKFKPEELRQAAKSAVEEPRITEDKRLVLVSKLTKKALQLGDIETSQYLGAALQQLSQQAGQSLESMKQVNDELTAYAPLLAYVNAVKPKGDPVAVPATGPIREAWNELKRALGNTMSLGAVADPEAIAKAQIDVYKALFRLAKVAAQEGVKSAKEFAERFGLKLTDSVKHAWQQAKTEKDPTTPPSPILKDAGRLVISEPKKRRAKAQEFSQEVYDKMKGLAEKASKMPDGLQKNEVLQEMTKQLEDSLGLGWKDALLGGDWWYASVLMRLGTFANVAVGSGTTGVAWNILGALDAATVGRSPKVALQMLSAFWQGVMDGGLVAKEIVQKGNYALLPDYQRRVEKFLIGKKGGKGDALEAMLRRGNPLGVLAYTRRIMAALDYIAAQGTRDAGIIYAAMAAGDQASLEASQKRFDKQLSAQASEQARNELGKAAPALQVRLRAREILEEGIDSEIKENALRLARRAAQNADPVGLSGVIYKALSRLPLWVKAPTGLAFLRAGLNMVQTASDFVPGIGAVTYARSSKAFQDRFKDSEHGKFLALDLPPEQRRLAAASQVVGVGILMAGAAWALDDDEKKEVEISGGWRNVTPQQAKELRAVGEQPYAIKIGDKWWSYRQTPFAAAIAMIGAIRDNRRFDKEKWDEKSVMDKVITAAYSGVAYIKDIAALSQVAKIMGGDAGRTEDASIDQTNQFFAQTVGRYLSGYIPSIVKEAEDFMDPTVRAPLRDDFLGQWVKNLPVTFQEAVGKVNRPALNFFGEPAKSTRPPLRSLATVEKPEPEYRLVAKWMSEGLFIPQANRTAQVVDRNTGEKRRMTDEEFYVYQREYGQFFKEVLTSDIKEFEGMDREQASRFLANIAPKASKVARAKLD